MVTSIPRIGDKTAYRFIAFVGDVEQFEHPKQVAAFMGLNPSQCRSGTSIRGRGAISRTSCAYLRKSMYMPANEATRATSPNTYPLSNFTMQLPKGGDLHNHFTGAVYPWQLINYAKNDRAAPAWCIKKTSSEETSYRVTIDNNCVPDGGSLLSSISTMRPII